MRPLRTSVNSKVTKEDFQDRSQVPLPKGSPPKLTDADTRREVVQLANIGKVAGDPEENTEPPDHKRRT
jgi:hypothetical protein